MNTIDDAVMARLNEEVLSQMSEIVIASQPEHSSPNAVDPNNDTADSVEVVEDSVPKEWRGGAIQIPKAVEHDGEDELYSLTPKAKERYGKRKTPAGIHSSHAQSRLLLRATGQDVNGGAMVLDQPGGEKRKEKPPARSTALDKPWYGGATVSKQEEGGQDTAACSDGQARRLKQAAARTSHPSNAEQEITSLAEDARKGMTIASPSKVQQTNHLSGEGERGLDSNPVANIGRTRTSKPISALDALRSRQRHRPERDGQAPLLNNGSLVINGVKKGAKSVPGKPDLLGTGTGKKPEVEDATSANERSVITQQPAYKQLIKPQTPARNAAQSPEAESIRIKGKLQTVIKAPSSKAVASKKKKSRARDLPNDPISESAAPDSGVEASIPTKRDGVIEQAMTRRTASKARPATAKRSTTFDIPSSSDVQEAPKSTQKARTTKKSAIKAGSKAIHATPAEAVATADGINQTKVDEAKPTRNRGRPGRNNAVAPAKATPNPNVRTRMMLQNAKKMQDVRHETTASTLRAPVQPKTVDSAAAQNLFEPLKETIDDFEQPVVDFGDDEGDTHTREMLSHRRLAVASTVLPPVQGTTKADEQDAAGTHYVSKALPSKEQQGSSHDNAIVLSDREESSSPLTPESQETNTAVPEDQKVHHLRRHAEPTTPIVYPSSPPLASEKVPPSTSASTRKAAKEKPSLISFTKSGPLDQGRVSAGNKAPSSIKTNCTSLDRQGLAMLSEAGSMAKLELRRVKGPSSIATSVRSTRAPHTIRPNNVASDVAGALSDFTSKSGRGHVTEEARDGSSTTYDTCKPQPHQQIQHPHEDDDGFMDVDDIDESTFVTQATLPLVLAQAQDDSIEPSEFSKGDSILNENDSPHFSVQPETAKPKVLRRSQGNGGGSTSPANISLKRSLAGEDTQQPLRKRVRVLSAKDVAGTQSLQDQSSAQYKSVNKVDRSSISARGMEAVAPKHAEPGSRKPSRTTSYGSQRVDMVGSPVPFGTVVPERSTALETYAEQIQMSSGSLPPSTKIPKKVSVPARIDEAALTQELAPPALDVARMSSNSKRLPSAPNEGSEAITGFARMNPGGPLVKHVEGSEQPDPFTSSEEGRLKPARTSSTSSYRLRIEQAKAETEKRAPRDSVRGGIDDDPDKTLFEAEPRSRLVAHERDRSVSSSSDSSYTDDSNVAQHDLTLWRNALLPHQANLFDELVNVSHRLVQHLVEKEVAASNIVDDYRQRGLALIKEMESSRQKRMQSLVGALVERKKRLRKELSECCGKLDVLRSAAKIEQRSSSKQAAEGLQNVLDQYC